MQRVLLCHYLIITDYITANIIFISIRFELYINHAWFTEEMAYNSIQICMEWWVMMANTTLLVWCNMTILYDIQWTKKGGN